MVGWSVDRLVSWLVGDMVGCLIDVVGSPRYHCKYLPQNATGNGEIVSLHEGIVILTIHPLFVVVFTFWRTFLGLAGQ